MTVTEHLDKIYQKGFHITLNWNEDFTIYYNANDVIPATSYDIHILSSSYYKSESNPYTFEDMVEVCCDIFYSWYNKNIKLIDDFDNLYDQNTLSKLESVCLGDIGRSVARELNLNDILDLYE